MSNLIDLQSQIEKLQKQADDLRAKEFDKTVQDIIAKMRAFGITAKDLKLVGFRRAKTDAGSGAKMSRGKAKRTKSGTVAAKYRGPNGEAWSGRGLPPRWLASLVAQGQKKEDFAIKS